MITAKIILDSISSSGVRLTTFVLTYQRFIHPEVMTHRSFSRNASSSRARPIKKVIEDIIKHPAMPVHWGRNQAGMQAWEEIEDIAEAIDIWEEAMDAAIASAEELIELGVHKQITNRILEPYSHITVICTATEWSNFFNLRCDKDAQPEIRELAFKMLKEYYESTPKLLSSHDWHMPYLTEEDESLDLETKKMISVARCARVSYLTHDGKRDIQKDLDLFKQLAESGHMSPMEHVARPSSSFDSFHPSGNFRGWCQLRQFMPNQVRTEIPSYEEVLDFLK